MGWTCRDRVTGVTVMTDVPSNPSELAVMVAVPAASPVTNPVPSTLATAASLVLQATDLPATAFPLAS